MGAEDNWEELRKLIFIRPQSIDEAEQNWMQAKHHVNEIIRHLGEQA